MKYIGYTQIKMLIADEGKKIRLKSDEYKEATDTEPEHIPYYTDIIFLPNISGEEAMKMYIEEEV